MTPSDLNSKIESKCEGGMQFTGIILFAPVLGHEDRRMPIVQLEPGFKLVVFLTKGRSRIKRNAHF